MCPLFQRINTKKDREQMVERLMQHQADLPIHRNIILQEVYNNLTFEVYWRLLKVHICNV